MGTNCAPLLADIFLYSYEAESIQSLLSTGKEQLASRFNLTYRYIDDVLSIKTEIENFHGPDLSCWTSDQGHYREHHFCFVLRFTTVDLEGWSTSHFHLRQTRWFQFSHHKRSVLPSSPAYGVFISQLIRYARACSSYKCFILSARRLSSKLLKQGYLVERLKSPFRKFYCRYGDLIQQYEVSL